MGNASAEAAITAAGEAAEDGPGAPLATTHGPAAEVLNEGAECDVGMGNAAEAPVAAAATGVRPPRTADWGSGAAGDGPRAAIEAITPKPANWGSNDGPRKATS